MDSCLCHILESPKGIEIKHGTYIDVNRGAAEDKNHNTILHFTWVIFPDYFHKRVVFFLMSWCTIVFDYKICLL